MEFDASSTLTDDCKQLFSSKQYSDFTVVADCKEFYVHKGILAMRSPVFAKMIHSGLCESSSSTLVLEDSSAKIIEALLCFVYTDKIGESWSLEEALNLFKLAHKYDIKGLRPYCVDFIHKHINLDNCFEMLETAELYESEELKNVTTLFILTRSVQLKYQGKWEKFQTLSDSLKLHLWNAVAHNLSVRNITC